MGAVSRLWKVPEPQSAPCWGESTGDASGALSTNPSHLLLNKPSCVLAPLSMSLFLSLSISVSLSVSVFLIFLSLCLSLHLCLSLSLSVSLSLSPYLSLPYLCLSVSLSLSTCLSLHLCLCLSLSLLVSGSLLPSLSPWLFFGGQAMFSEVSLTAEGPRQKAPPSSVQAEAPLVCVWEESMWGSPPPQP